MLTLLLLTTIYGIFFYWILGNGQDIQAPPLDTKNGGKGAKGGAKEKKEKKEQEQLLILSQTMRNLLNISIAFVLVALGMFLCIVIIVLCVYLKEHFKTKMYGEEDENGGIQMGNHRQYEQMEDEEDLHQNTGSPYYDRD